MRNLSELINSFPIKAKHKQFGDIDIFGVRTQSSVSNNIMYLTKVNGDYVWVYDYEVEIAQNCKKRYLFSINRDTNPNLFKIVANIPYFIITFDSDNHSLGKVYYDNTGVL